MEFVRAGGTLDDPEKYTEEPLGRFLYDDHTQTAKLESPARLEAEGDDTPPQADGRPADTRPTAATGPAAPIEIVPAPDREMNSPPLVLRSLSRRIPLGVRPRAARVGAPWDPWCRFWFEPADPTPLAAMRILFGGMLLYTHIVWGLNLEGFIGPHGWQGETLVRTLQADQFAWSFWWWVPVSLHVTVHLACLVILAAFMLGAFTPVTSVLAYLIIIAYANRAPMANYGLDQINGMAALYLAIGPSGRVLSIDRLRTRLRAARTQLSQGLQPAIPRVEPSARANLALRLIQVHLCVIYIFACLSKLQGESWWNGLAIWQAVSNLEYQTRDLTWLAWYPWLVNLLTHATIAWEMTFWRSSGGPRSVRSCCSRARPSTWESAPSWGCGPSDWR